MKKQEKKKVNYLKESEETSLYDQSINNITKDDIDKASELLNKYKEGKTNFESRIIDNEQWFKLRHWEQMRKF
jgi:outer membrane protein assembly factor BamD (BamD/ComL family)